MYVNKQQPENSSIGSWLNLKLKSSLPSENCPKQKRTVPIKTCSKRKLKDTVPEESCTKRKSQSSVQSDPKVDHTCLKCHRIFQTSQHKDCQGEEKECLGCNYCIACVCEILIPDQPVEVPSQEIEVIDTMSEVLNDSVIFETTDVHVATSNKCVTSDATKVAGTLGNYVMSENSCVAKKNIKGNHVTTEKSHEAGTSMLGYYVTCGKGPVANQSMSGNHVASGVSDVATRNHVTRGRVMPMKVYRCSFCNDVFKSNCDAQFHKLVEHEISKRRACTKCNVYLRGINMIATHEMIKLHCFHCGKDFLSSRDVISHWTRKKVGGIVLVKSKRNPNSMSLEIDRLYISKFEKDRSHRLFCGICKKTYGTECHPNYHNLKDVFNLYRCINCLAVLISQQHIDWHENDQLHCVYCNAHFSSQEECVQHRLRVTLRPDKGTVSVPRGKKGMNKSSLGVVGKTSLSILPLSAGNDKMNTSGTLSSSLPLLVENRASNALGMLPSSLSVSARNTIVNAPDTLLFSMFSLTTSAGNVALNVAHAVPSSFSMSAANTTNVLPLALPSTLPMTAKYAVGAKGQTLPSSLPVSSGNPTVNAMVVLPTNLPVSKDGK